MNFNYLVKTESQCLELSRKNHPSWFDLYPSIINSFFEVSYFAGNEDDIESVEGMFLTFAHNHLLKIPYTIRATSNLKEIMDSNPKAKIFFDDIKILIEL